MSATRRALVLLIFVSFLDAAVAIAGMVALMPAAMLFDDPPPAAKPLLTVHFALVAATPLAALAGIVGAWGMFARGRRMLAVRIAAVPLAVAAAAAVSLFLVFAIF